MVVASVFVADSDAADKVVVVAGCEIAWTVVEFLADLDRFVVVAGSFDVEEEDDLVGIVAAVAGTAAVDEHIAGDTVAHVAGIVVVVDMEDQMALVAAASLSMGR